MGYLAAQQLITAIENQQQNLSKDLPNENIVVPVRLIERQTVKKL